MIGESVCCKISQILYGTCSLKHTGSLQVLKIFLFVTHVTGVQVYIKDIQLTVKKKVFFM